VKTEYENVRFIQNGDMYDVYYGKDYHLHCGYVWTDNTTWEFATLEADFSFSLHDLRDITAFLEQLNEGVSGISSLICKICFSRGREEMTDPDINKCYPTETAKQPAIEPCPFPECGNECKYREYKVMCDSIPPIDTGHKIQRVECCKCEYVSKDYKNEVKTIAAHNALSIKMQLLSQYKHFAKLARPIVEDVEKAWHGSNTRTYQLRSDATTCLAALPEPLSWCCNVPAKVYTADDLGGENTSYYVCSKCGQPFMTAEEKNNETG
jgi:hypothetical protein